MLEVLIKWCIFFLNPTVFFQVGFDTAGSTEPHSVDVGELLRNLAGQ